MHHGLYIRGIIKISNDGLLLQSSSVANQIMAKFSNNETKLIFWKTMLNLQKENYYLNILGLIDEVLLNL